MQNDWRGVTWVQKSMAVELLFNSQMIFIGWRNVFYGWHLSLKRHCSLV